MHHHHQRLLRRLVQRASTPGVLDSGQVGVSVHALRRLDCLSVHNSALCTAVAALTGDADARTVANVLHNFALSTREQCDVRSALPADFIAAMATVQESLVDVADDLTAPESIMAAEALLWLLPYRTSSGCSSGGCGDGITPLVQRRLLSELQARTVSLTQVVERPIELLGILRVIMEAKVQGDRSAAAHRKSGGATMIGPDRDNVSVDDIFSGLGESDGGDGSGSGTATAGSGGRASIGYNDDAGEEGEEASAQWADAALRRVTAAVEARLDGWSRQDLISLLDTITVRSNSNIKSNNHACNDGGGDDGMAGPSSSSSSPSSSQLLDAARPLALHALDRSVSMAAALSASQCAAWLVRLAHLRLYPGHPLLMRVVRRLLPPSQKQQEGGGESGGGGLVSMMTASQLASSANALVTILNEQPVQHHHQQQLQRQRSGDSGAGAVDAAAAAASDAAGSLSLTDQDACVELFAALFSRLTSTAADGDARRRTSTTGPTAATAAAAAVSPSASSRAVRADLFGLLSLSGLPEASIVGYCQRHPSYSAALVPVVLTTSLEQACSVLLRHSDGMMPAEVTQVVCTALHWHVYSGTVTTALPCGGGGGGAGVVITCGWEVVWRHPPSAAAGATPERRLRKLRALAGLATSDSSSSNSGGVAFNAIDLMQMTNEAAMALHRERGAAALVAGGGGDMSSTRGTATINRGTLAGSRRDLHQQTIATLESLALALHLRLQRRLAADGVTAEAVRLQQSLRHGQQQKRERRRQRQQESQEAEAVSLTTATVTGPVAPMPPMTPVTTTTADSLSTPLLCRYLTTLSKLAIRTVGEYYTILSLLQRRDQHHHPLTAHELTTVLYTVARHHLQAPYFLSSCVRRLPELSQALSPSDKAALLKHLGQVNGQRFVRSPVHPNLDGGTFFRDGAELAGLTYLEATFAFNGLMELRQYDNTTVRWLLQGPLNNSNNSGSHHHRGSGSAGGASSLPLPLPLHQTVGYIRSTTTLCELVVSLCRLGVPSWVPNGTTTPPPTDTIGDQTLPPSPLSPFSPTSPFSELSLLLELTADAMRAVAHLLPTSRGLFTDLSRLTRAWPVLSSFPVLFQEAVLDALPGLSRDERATLAEQLGDVIAAEWAGTCAAARGPLAARVADIARDPSLRPNTFLYTQLAAAVCLDALPANVAERRRLYANLELRKLPHLLGSSRQMVDATVVGLHTGTGQEQQQQQGGGPSSSTTDNSTATAAAAELLSPAEVEEISHTILTFVRSSLMSLRAQDVLAVWWLTDQALRRSHDSSSSGGGGGGALVERSREAARSIRDAAKEQLMEESHHGKLSPMEMMVRGRLL